MKSIALFSIFLLCLNQASGQEFTWDWWKDYEKVKNAGTTKQNPEIKPESKDRLATIEIIDGDTIYLIALPDLVIMDQEYKKKYDNHLYYIKRMYPYAKLIASLSADLDSTLMDLEQRKARRKYLEKNKDIAMAQFESAIKSMSIREGKYLVKLIHRECGETAYDVISKYLGGTKTFLWQTASRLGGADLKLKYDPTGEDKIMEDIMLKVDKGEIKVKKIKIDPNAIEKKEAAEALAKQKKKEEKKKKK